MEHLVSAESIIMQDLGPNSTEQSSSKNPPLKGDNEPANEKRILQARLKYIRSLLEIENEAPSPTPDVRLALESEMKNLEAKIKSIEGKMTELLPRPIASSPQNNKPKPVKRSAAPVVKPAKTSKSKSTTDSDYVFPKKTVKNPPLVEKKDINTNNSFEVLDSEMTDVEEERERESPQLIKPNPFLCEFLIPITWFYRIFTENFPQQLTPTLKDT
ncbi:hypothetical protein TNCV_3544301 [Trichonephila clavipes]|nr:hypothetical protein TNCV_3544301 [Trichonephila clavipes]